LKHLFRLNKYFVKYKWHLLSGIVFVFLSNYFRIKIPQTIRDALNSIFDLVQSQKTSDNSGDFSLLFGSEVTKYALYVVGFALVMGVFMYLMRQTIIVMSRLIEYDIRKEIYDHYQGLDTAFYKGNKTGDLMSRVAEDVGKVRMYLGPALLYGINLIGLCVLVIYAMLKVNVELTFYTLIPLPFLSLSIYYVSRLINKRSENIQKQLSVLTANSQEVYSGIRVLKSYGVEDRFRSTPGTIAEFIIYVNYLTWPFTSIGWIASIVQQAEASQKRINAILDTQSTVVNEGTDTSEIVGKIEFRDVKEGPWLCASGWISLQ